MSLEYTGRDYFDQKDFTSEDTADQPDTPDRDDIVPEVASRKEMVAASEYKRMLGEAALVEETADNIMNLTKKLTARYAQILESVDVLAALGFSETEAAGLAFRFGLVPNNPLGGSQPSESIECLRDLRDALPETS
jgi:hypothetical protein